MNKLLIMDSVMRASKFRGCLLGSLLGDCLGAPFEGDETVSKQVLQKYFDKLEGPYFKAPVKQYTDDTAMTKSVADSLITTGGFDPLDLAKRFVKEFFNDPRRGYGGNVIDVFHKLRGQKFKDPFGPAKEQFDGSGSLGNGGAMRVAPIALFYCNNYHELINISKQSAYITHTNKLGYDGTVLQAITIQQSLLSDPGVDLNTKDFTDKLIEKMSVIEKDDEGLGLQDAQAYQKQLKEIQKLLVMEGGAPDETVRNSLGTEVTALYSVPTALFCFLRAQQSIKDIETDNPFRRTLQYAISLGGDTDTIASMAGAIAGAYYGDGVISESLIKHCELAQEIINCADMLHSRIN